MIGRRNFAGWVGALSTAGIAGCAAPPPRREAIARPLWPSPPEQPRFAFEATLRNAASLSDDPEASRLRRALTGEDPGRDSFSKPMAVAAARGRVYVSDTEARRVFVFDLPRRRTFSFGLRLDGQLKKPGGLAIDGRGRVYVVDSTARRLVVYDALGLYLGQIDGGTLWQRPTAVAVNAAGDRIHVVDTGGVESDAHGVHVYDDEARLLRSLTRRGEGEGEFNLPTDAAVAADGTLWVLDAGNFRLQAFDREGRFLRAFGSPGNGIGQFARPRGLAVDAEGLLYVSDALLCNVQVFRPDGTLLLALGARAGRGDAPGRYLLPAKLACDETGRLYVVDQFLHKVEVLRRLSEEEGRRLLESAS